MIKSVVLKLCFFLFFIVAIYIYFIQWIDKLKCNLQPKVRQTKTILLWNKFFDSPDYYFGLGFKPFTTHQCPVYDCFITNDRQWINVKNFDAIVFHGAEYYPTDLSQMPHCRSEHQRYIYMSKESPANRPLDLNLRYYFNWTMTYRLDSDISAFYFRIYDFEKNPVSPDVNPKWIEPDFNSINLEKFTNIFARKKYPVAWFASNCHASNHREKYVRNLQNYIKIDIYGSCGPNKCPRNRKEECFQTLKNDYYFYLSFENSNCQDYVTEKVVNAMNNDVIPVVLGGANYTRFLPPHSYVDASNIQPKQLASKLQEILSNQTRYMEYFWWRNYYVLGDDFQMFCKLCSLLHDNYLPKKIYDMYEWWHGPQNNPICH